MTEEIGSNAPAAPVGGAASNSGGSNAPAPEYPQITDLTDAGKPTLRDMTDAEKRHFDKHGRASWKKKPETQQQQPKDDDDAPEREEPEGLEFEQAEDEEGRETVSVEGGYKLEVSDEIPQDDRQRITEQIGEAGVLAKSIGIEQGIVQEFVDYAVALGVSDESRVDLSNQDACWSVLNTRYGKEEAAKIAKDAYEAVQRLGPKTAEYLDRTGLGNSPAVLMALAAYRRGDFHLAPEAAQAQLEALRSNKGYFNTNEKNSRLVRDRASLLYTRLARKSAAPDASSKAAASKTEKVTADQASLDKRIKEAIADPAYRDSNHPKHKEAVDRAESLYNARWRD